MGIETSFAGSDQGIRAAPRAEAGGIRYLNGRGACSRGNHILAAARRRSPHWLMREAIEQYVEREEKRERFRQEALAAWTHYQTTGLHATAVGVALVLGSALSFAIYLLRSGQTVQRLGSTIVTIYATGIACIACVLQFVCLRPLSALRLPWQVHALGVALALFSTVLPIWLVTEAIRRLGASTAAMIATLGPVLTILLANLFLHEPLNLLQFAGAALVILSVMYLTARKRALAPS